MRDAIAYWATVVSFGLLWLAVVLLSGCSARQAPISAHHCTVAGCCDWEQQNAHWARSETGR